MAWKCPHCNKKLAENDATRGNCPFCFQVFDLPEELQEEAVSDEEPAPNLPITRNPDSALLWLSLTTLCLLLVSLFLEIWHPSEKYQPASTKIETGKTDPGQAEPLPPTKESEEVKSIRLKEKEIAQTVLFEYGTKTCQKIKESLKQEYLLQQKDEAKFGNLFGSPIGLAHTQLQSVYTQYGQAYLLLLDANKNSDGLKIITNDITVSDTDFAKGKLVIQSVTPLSLDAKNSALFNAVHSEPYQFLVSCTRPEKEWKVKEWTIIGTDWNFRPLPR
ncbi:MAG: hypothetical protein NTY10_05010 [Candidatus Omnitrophica bacterium]|nr:hypothetical protein [Candidatus Omnitrophota bacterium]